MHATKKPEEEHKLRETLTHLVGQFKSETPITLVVAIHEVTYALKVLNGKYAKSLVKMAQLMSKRFIKGKQKPGC